MHCYYIVGIVLFCIHKKRILVQVPTEQLTLIVYLGRIHCSFCCKAAPTSVQKSTICLICALFLRSSLYEPSHFSFNRGLYAIECSYNLFEFFLVQTIKIIIVLSD